MAVRAVKRAEVEHPHGMFKWVSSDCLSCNSMSKIASLRLIVIVGTWWQLCYPNETLRRHIARKNFTIFKPLSDNSCWNVWSFAPRLFMNTKRDDFVIFLLRSTCWWFWQLWSCTTDLPDGQRSSVSADRRDESARLNTCWLHRFVHWGLLFFYIVFPYFLQKFFFASIRWFCALRFLFSILDF